MNIIASSENLFVLNLARGEELHETLRAFCKEAHIVGATFTGLGASDRADLAYYNFSTKSFERHHVDEELEILSLNGNLGTLKGEKILHIHGVFGRRNLSTLGGHVFELRVSGACEIHLTAFPGPLTRTFDEVTGLNLLACNTPLES